MVKRPTSLPQQSGVPATFRCATVAPTPARCEDGSVTGRGAHTHHQTAGGGPGRLVKDQVLREVDQDAVEEDRPHHSRGHGGGGDKQHRKN